MGPRPEAGYQGPSMVPRATVAGQPQATTGRVGRGAWCSGLELVDGVKPRVGDRDLDAWIPTEVDCNPVGWSECCIVARRAADTEIGFSKSSAP